MEENQKTKTRKIVYGGLLTAVGLILPQAFHIFGANAGRTFLPMHLPVLAAGLLLGPLYGGCIGAIVPLLSSVLTGMPPAPMLYFMMAELVGYGVFSGLTIRRWNVYPSLIISMVLGRALYGLSLLLAVKLLGFTFPFANQAAFVGGILTGIPGIAIQLILIPLIYKALKKEENLSWTED